ncbi:50S ribosomal protein L11 methyltransferase [Camelimonas abortus]|uniref:Ribosomal protein L11 methyltransferase n=1 Tax=Camelimonas abortus TaxID=1017184 RepID=A0ABV7LFL8_9HYPH
MIEGLQPQKATRVMRFITDEARARQITEILGEIFDPAETAVSTFETDAGWLFEAYFATPPDEEMIIDVIRPIVGEAAANAATFDDIREQDWVRASLDGLKPVRAGRILVHGGHDRGVARSNDVGLEIEAALAFGTGHHGTTAGCLDALARIASRRRPRSILDVGTGTGILAIAAAKWLKVPVVAGDLDPVAIEVAAGNARGNGVAGLVSYYVAPGVDHALARGRRFELVFANILARPLRLMAPSLARAVAPGGVLVLSGLLPRDVPGVLSAYRAQGLALWERRDRDGWSTLTLRRGGAAPRPLAAA